MALKKSLSFAIAKKTRAVVMDVPLTVPNVEIITASEINAPPYPPNNRPVQTTTDLPGFWQRLYPEIRKQLSRRYPKHKWP